MKFYAPLKVEVSAITLLTVISFGSIFSNVAIAAPTAAAPAGGTASGGTVTAKDKLIDGHYSCRDASGKSVVALGDLQITGTTFRGLRTEGDSYPYTIDASGNIKWSHEFSAMEDGWKVTSSKNAGVNKDGKAVIKINYTTADGKPATMDAVHD